jgi:hypothetical protein
MRPVTTDKQARRATAYENSTDQREADRRDGRERRRRHQRVALPNEEPDVGAIVGVVRRRPVMTPSILTTCWLARLPDRSPPVTPKQFHRAGLLGLSEAAQRDGRGRNVEMEQLLVQLDEPMLVEAVAVHRARVLTVDDQRGGQELPTPLERRSR